MQLQDERVCGAEMWAPDVHTEVLTSRAAGDPDHHKEKRSWRCFNFIKGKVQFVKYLNT